MRRGETVPLPVIAPELEELAASPATMTGSRLRHVGVGPVGFSLAACRSAGERGARDGRTPNVRWTSDTFGGTWL